MNHNQCFPCKNTAPNNNNIYFVHELFNYNKSVTIPKYVSIKKGEKMANSKIQHLNNNKKMILMKHRPRTDQNTQIDNSVLWRRTASFYFKLKVIILRFGETNNGTLANSA